MKSFTFKGVLQEVHTGRITRGEFSCDGADAEEALLNLVALKRAEGCFFRKIDTEQCNAIVPDPCFDDHKRDYTAALSQGNGLWLSVGPFSVKLTVNGGEGLSVDIFAQGQEMEGSLSSSHALFDDAANEILLEHETGDYVSVAT